MVWMVVWVVWWFDGVRSILSGDSRGTGTVRDDVIVGPPPPAKTLDGVYG